jgi:NAD(P)-dependent dehydrogenase (short-subunit alcohol dehydrogenase family)
MELRGKTAVITGASRGIGKAIAVRFARQGANIAFNYLEHEHEAAEAAREMEQFGAEAVYTKGDIALESSVNELIDTALQRFGAVDILVNNAGSGLTRDFANISASEWDYMISVHLRGVFLACQLAGVSMRARRSGSIINIASVAGEVALPQRVIYGTVEAGKMMFTKALACEWAPFGIRVNCIAPGTILTDLVMRNFERGLLDGTRVLERTPLARFGEPSEIASVALFLASAQSSYVTGQTLFVDGGWTSWGGWPVAKATQ